MSRAAARARGRANLRQLGQQLAEAQCQPEPVQTTLPFAQLHRSNSITQVLGERILPFISPLSNHAHTNGVGGGANETAASSSTASTCVTPNQELYDSVLIRQLRGLFRPFLRCRPSLVLDGSLQQKRPTMELIERWIEQLKAAGTTPVPLVLVTDTHPPTTTQLTSTTSRSTVHAALCDLFHPLMISRERASQCVQAVPVLPLTVNECKLNNETSSGNHTGGTEVTAAAEDSQHSQVEGVLTTPSSSFSYITLVDLIIDLYSEFGICRQHENQSRTDRMSTNWKDSYNAYGDMLDELTRLPHQLWKSWSQNQRPLLQPLIHQHLIPDLTNITLEYLLGNESTVPIQIDRKPQPIYRWRVPLLEWRRERSGVNSDSDSESNEVTSNHSGEYSPEFELDGLRWRLQIYPNGHGTPNRFVVYLDSRDESTFRVACHAQIRLIHPTDPNKSLLIRGLFRDTFDGRGVKIKSEAIPKFTHTIDGCVVVEVAISNVLH